MLFFCPSCGNILIIEEDTSSHRFTCNTCPFISKIKRKITTKTYPRLKVGSQKTILKLCLNFFSFRKLITFWVALRLGKTLIQRMLNARPAHTNAPTSCKYKLDQRMNLWLHSTSAVIISAATIGEIRTDALLTKATNKAAPRDSQQQQHA